MIAFPPSGHNSPPCSSKAYHSLKPVKRSDENLSMCRPMPWRIKSGNLQRTEMQKLPMLWNPWKKGFKKWPRIQREWSPLPEQHEQVQANLKQKVRQDSSDLTLFTSGFTCLETLRFHLLPQRFFLSEHIIACFYDIRTLGYNFMGQEFTALVNAWQFLTVVFGPVRRMSTIQDGKQI